MNFLQPHNITTDPILHPVFLKKNIKAYMLRLDKIHPLISGNKWFKLKYFIAEAEQKKAEKIITYGGPWSNHILATAAACQLFSLPCAGIIRGEKPHQLSPILKLAEKLGMQLFFLSGKDFELSAIPVELQTEKIYVIPKGGSDENGIRGASEILNYADQATPYTHILCAAGTGTTLAGLMRAARPTQQITGISVVKNNFSLNKWIEITCKNSSCRFDIRHEFHLGGFAKKNHTLIAFINSWYEYTGIPTDFVYTAKLCYAAVELAKQDYFPKHSHVLLIHTGGMCGNLSLDKGKLIFEKGQPNPLSLLIA
ncbi:MAG: pyridoxal-phosphate dependent enzyme [Chitinophagaceae bacterium]|nr:pyridoxal-phosphate dependent enzyme [Chitinophagaceae bacterium]